MRGDGGLIDDSREMSLTLRGSPVADLERPLGVVLSFGWNKRLKPERFVGEAASAWSSYGVDDELIGVLAVNCSSV